MTPVDREEGGLTPGVEGIGSRRDPAPGGVGGRGSSQIPGTVQIQAARSGSM